ncbi:ABC transporter ATP-binding protein [Myxococcota bacterium]|nr:ABC transporter ATP-binding protein [Myxococcota bacterium]
MKLELRDVTRNYPVPGARGQTFAAVRGVSLVIEPGELHVVTGPSGCGKTTLLAMAAGLLTPSNGTVLWDGVEAGRVPISPERGQRVGAAFQEAPFVDELTVRENLLLPATFASLPRIDVRAEKLLERLGLAERAAWLPSALSGGERRRLAVARALVGTPELVVLDEPTSDLDRDWAREVIDLFTGRAKKLGATLLVASHDEAVITAATHHHAMEKGELRPTPR